MRSDAKNLEVIAKAIDTHNASCPFPASAVCLNPYEVERLGWDSVKGVPIQPDPALATGRYRIVCGGEEDEPGEVVEAVADEPLVVPLNT